MTIAMTGEFDGHVAAKKSPTMPVSVQVLSTLLFAGFAIPVTIVALNIFWPAGFALAVILAWRGGFAPNMSGRTSKQEIEDTVKSLIPESSAKSSGNKSFDAYRTELLTRLETEQENFENFLGRLREAKDKSEFDQFMEDRAHITARDDDRIEDWAK